MKVSNIICKALKVEEINSDKINGKRINISLGFNKGFAIIIWNIKDSKFSHYSNIKEGSTLIIPSGDLSSTTYTASNGKVYNNITIFTNYLEEFKMFDKKVDKQYNNEKQTNKWEEYNNDSEDSAFGSLEDLGKNVDQAKETTTETKEESNNDVDWEEDLE